MHALNRSCGIGDQIDDVIRAHRPRMSTPDRAARIIELLGIVGIPADRANSFPHELSGGMRQRAMIASAWRWTPRSSSWTSRRPRWTW